MMMSSMIMAIADCYETTCYYFSSTYNTSSMMIVVDFDADTFEMPIQMMMMMKSTIMKEEDSSSLDYYSSESESDEASSLSSSFSWLLVLSMLLPYLVVQASVQDL